MYLFSWFLYVLHVNLSRSPMSIVQDDDDEVEKPDDDDSDWFGDYGWFV